MGVALKLEVFGREMEVLRQRGRWTVYYLGAEGKKRLAPDVRIPDELNEADIALYLADVCHEWATPRHDSVVVIAK